MASPSILDLPDDIILHILQGIDQHEIVNVSFTCERLARICRDHTLWVHADFGNAITTSQADIAIEYFCSKTKFIRLKGRPENPFGRRLIQRIMKSCPNLRTLILEDWVLQLNVCDLPQKLWRLSIAGCQIQIDKKRKRKFCHGVKQERSYFFGLHLALPLLQSLNLSRCLWMDNHSLLALSKCQHLRELSLNGCQKMGGCVAYSALASGMGFVSLQRLDVRNTSMEDIDLKYFLAKPNILHFFMGTNLPEPDPRVPLTDQELAEWERQHGLEPSPPVESCNPQEEEEEEEDPASSSLSSEESSDNESDSDSDPPSKIIRLDITRRPTGVQIFNGLLVSDNGQSAEQEAATDPSPSTSSQEPGPSHSTPPEPSKKKKKKCHTKKRAASSSKSCSEDYEQFLEVNGRNVIVLNYSRGKITTETDMYGPRTPKAFEPGASITDHLVRHSVGSKQLQVLAVGGCKKVTDNFLHYLVHHGVVNLRLLDVRETAVQQRAINQLVAYLGGKVTVLHSIPTVD